MPQNPSEYAKLRAVWYKKLQEEGFDDIESDDNNLKVWSSNFAGKKSLKSWQAKASYYYMANNFLNEYKFESDKQKLIWEYHSNAISVRDIAKLLNKTKLWKKTNYVSVWTIITKLEDTMKKMYMRTSDYYRE